MDTGPGGEKGAQQTHPTCPWTAAPGNPFTLQKMSLEKVPSHWPLRGHLRKALSICQGQATPWHLESPPCAILEQVAGCVSSH